MNTLEDIESQFWDVYSKILPDEDIKPINLEEEKHSFMRSIAVGRSYNPRFSYRKVDNKKYIDELSAIAEAAEKIDGYVATQYVTHAKKLSDWVTNFHRRDEKFGSWLHQLYGSPESETLKKAQKVLNEAGFLECDKQNITSKDAVEFFYNTLEEYNFFNWTVQYQSMPAKIRISSAEKTIYIDKDSQFSDSELLRLSVHEIGTHVLRFENGSKQNNMIYRYGFPDYLECEEGLAIFSEDKSGRLSNYDIGKYCLRVIASDLAEHSSFWDIYSFVSKYIEKDQAFSITTRVKRGLFDTSQSYGYTKDQLYYSGYLKMKGLRKDDIDKLYIGKIGFSQLSNLDFTTVNQEHLYVPNWAVA